MALGHFEAIEREIETRKLGTWRMPDARLLGAALQSLRAFAWYAFAASKTSCFWRPFDAAGAGGREREGNGRRGGGRRKDSGVRHDGGEVYLSVIMVAWHDASPFCQQPKDSCLDRLRVSLSTILRALAVNSLARDSEIILVDYNPCHARTQSSSSPACTLPVEEGGASRTSSHPRTNTHTGFRPLARVVRDMVDAPVYYMCICIYVGVCIYMYV